MSATATPDALREAQELARQAATDRAHLVRGLRLRGLQPVDGVAPFVLVALPPGTRETLRQHGFAVRRGDTFPGLDAGWVRVAVRDTVTTDAFLVALDEVLAPATVPAAGLAR